MSTKGKEQWVLVVPPSGWAGCCHLPTRIPKKGESDCLAFSAEIGHFRHNGIVLDVTWTGGRGSKFTRAGQFKCVVIRSESDEPLETFKTPLPFEVFRWLLQKLETDWWSKEKTR